MSNNKEQVAIRANYEIFGQGFFEKGTSENILALLARLLVDIERQSTAFSLGGTEESGLSLFTLRFLSSEEEISYREYRFPAQRKRVFTSSLVLLIWFTITELKVLVFYEEKYTPLYRQSMKYLLFVMVLIVIALISSFRSGFNFCNVGLRYPSIIIPSMLLLPAMAISVVPRFVVHDDLTYSYNVGLFVVVCCCTIIQDFGVSLVTCIVATICYVASLLLTNKTALPSNAAVPISLYVSTLYFIGVVLHGYILDGFERTSWKRWYNLLDAKGKCDQQKEYETKLLSIQFPPQAVAQFQAGMTQVAASYLATCAFINIDKWYEKTVDLHPSIVLENLNYFFCHLDFFVVERGIEKVKTSGSTYLCAAGLPERYCDHPSRMADFLLDILKWSSDVWSLGQINPVFITMRKDLVKKISLSKRECYMLEATGSNTSTMSIHSNCAHISYVPSVLLPFDLCIGFNMGPMTAGVLGNLKSSYDIQGDTVNVASRFCNIASPGRIVCGIEVQKLLAPGFAFVDLGEHHVKGKGGMHIFNIVSRKDDAFSSNIIDTAYKASQMEHFCEDSIGSQTLMNPDTCSIGSSDSYLDRLKGDGMGKKDLVSDASSTIRNSVKTSGTFDSNSDDRISWAWPVNQRSLDFEKSPCNNEPKHLGSVFFTLFHCSKRLIKNISEVCFKAFKIMFAISYEEPVSDCFEVRNCSYNRNEVVPFVQEDRSKVSLPPGSFTMTIEGDELPQAFNSNEQVSGKLNLDSVRNIANADTNMLNTAMAEEALPTDFNCYRACPIASCKECKGLVPLQTSSSNAITSEVDKLIIAGPNIRFHCKAAEESFGLWIFFNIPSFTKICIGAVLFLQLSLISVDIAHRKGEHNHDRILISIRIFSVVGALIYICFMNKIAIRLRSQIESAAVVEYDSETSFTLSSASNALPRTNENIRILTFLQYSCVIVNLWFLFFDLLLYSLNVALPDIWFSLVKLYLYLALIAEIVGFIGVMLYVFYDRPFSSKIEDSVNIGSTDPYYSLLLTMLLLEIAFIFTRYTGEVFFRRQFIIFILERNQHNLTLAENKTIRQLLFNIMPMNVVQDLANIIPMESDSRVLGRSVAAHHLSKATILHLDVCAFTMLCARLTPEKVITALNHIYYDFDAILEVSVLEKITTNADAYTVMGHAINNAEHETTTIALRLLHCLYTFNVVHPVYSMDARIGIHTDRLFAGIMGGRLRMKYDIYGPAHTKAVILESLAPKGAINISTVSFENVDISSLKSLYSFETKEREVNNNVDIASIYIIPKWKRISRSST